MRSTTRTVSDWSKTQGRDINQPVFAELEFMRLANIWERCRRTTSLIGAACADKIFQRFEMVGAPLAWLDFAYRGFAMTDRGARTFQHTLLRHHEVSDIELKQLVEVLGPCLGGYGPQGFNQEIDYAEVGAVNGRMVLAVFWTHKKSGRKVISVFIDADGDGRVVHEMHFSATPELYAAHSQVFNDTMRSCQWRTAAPPMVGSVA